ncbi:hypothetical protein NPIL_221851 [Nephila pilipes]|uniref:Uncharacterized protein n=1 Tax=Nephila pilipes TaxID=299642 RepID=A0A8X6MQ69_NEPPI|nr:hypothetical protein NPIL_221851 [Nephila pilipes]
MHRTTQPNPLYVIQVKTNVNAKIMLKPQLIRERRPTAAAILAERRVGSLYLSDVPATMTARRGGLLRCRSIHFLKTVLGLYGFLLHVRSLLTKHGCYVN